MTDTLNLVYSLHLDQEELDGLMWAEERGYTGGAWKHCDHYHATALGVSMFYTESSAWEFKREAESDYGAFTTCLAPRLKSKLYALLMEIV